MIAGGRVLIDDRSLQSQGVKNGTQIMVVLLHDNPDEISEMSKNINELESIKADTKLLASKSDEYYMNVSFRLRFNDFNLYIFYLLYIIDNLGRRSIW